MDFTNKVVLVTGSSRGIGRATAIEFAKQGASVVVNYLNSVAEANQVVEEIFKIGSKAIAIRADVSQETEVQKLIEKTVKEFGKIDILVNNAGSVIDIPFEERTIDHWKQTLAVNLIGPFLCAKAVFPIMLENRNGSIINVASSNGIDILCPDSIDYDASKAALINLTRNLAAQFAPIIRVNAVAPGWVDTDMNKNLPKESISHQLERTYLKRLALPLEIANVIVFLASEKASFMTGSIVKVDGGYS